MAMLPAMRGTAAGPSGPADLVLLASRSGEGLLEPVVGIRTAAERGHFPVAVMGVKPPGLDEVTAGIQPQRGHLVAAEGEAQSVAESAVGNEAGQAEETGGSCALSFSAGTQVLLASGQTATISSLKPG